MGEFRFRSPAESWQSDDPKPKQPTSTLERAAAVAALIGVVGGLPMVASSARERHPGSGREQTELSAAEIKDALMERSLEQQPSVSLRQFDEEREAVSVEVPLDSGSTVSESRETLRVVADAQLTASLNENLPSYADVLVDLCGYEATTPTGEVVTRIDAEEAMLIYGNQLSFRESNLTRTINAVIGDEQPLTRRLLSPIINSVPGMGGVGTIGGVEMVGLDKLGGHYSDEELRDWHQGLYDEARSLVGMAIEDGVLTELPSEERRAAENQVRQAVDALTELRIAQAQISYAIAEGSSANEEWAFKNNAVPGIESGISHLQEQLTRLHRQFEDLDPLLRTVSGSELAEEIQGSLTADLARLMQMRGDQESQELLGMGSGTADSWYARAHDLDNLLRADRPSERMASIN